MEITLDQDFRKHLLQKIAQREFRERTGIHQSDLCFCLNKQALRKLHPQDPEDHELLLYSLGWATQRWLTGQDTDEPEKEVDGITVTLDAIHDVYTPTDHYRSPWELKATFQSSSRPIEENIHWVRQIMAQCYITGTTEAYLSRLEIMGNWKSIGKKEEKNLPENRKPTLSAYKLTFTQDELDRNWTWMQDRRDKFVKILVTRELLPKIEAIPSGQSWECGWCRFREKECSQS